MRERFPNIFGFPFRLGFFLYILSDLKDLLKGILRKINKKFCLN